jgi:signal transduction histidine kinase
MIDFTVLLISALFNFSLGLFVFKKQTSNKNHKAFFAFSSTLAVWVLFYAVSFVATNHTLLCTRLIVLAPIFFPITFNWFCNTLYSQDNKFQITEKLIHFSLIIIQLATLPTTLFITQASFVNNAILFTFGPIYTLQGLYIALGMGYGIFRLIKKYKHGNRIQKNQIQYMAMGVFLGTLVGVTFSYILPTLGFTEFNKFTTMASLFILFFANYAITKHRLMNIIIIVNKTTAWVISLTLFIATYLFILKSISSIMPITPTIQLFLSTTYALIMGFTFNPLRLFIQTSSKKQFLSRHTNFMDLLPEITRAFSACYNLESFQKIATHCIKDILEIDSGSIYINSKFYQGKLPIGVFTELDFTKETHKSITTDQPLITQLKHTQRLIIKSELKEIDQNMLADHSFTLCLPCFNEDKLSGFILLGPKLSEDIYTYDDFKFLEIMSSQMAIILERIIPFEKVQKDYEKTREYAEKISQQKAFTQLSMGIAHEIRNPISNLMLRAEIVEKQLDNPEAVLKFSDMIKRNITRILRITNSMLKYGTPTSKERKKGDVNETIKEVLEMVETKCNQNNIKAKLLLGPLQPLFYDEAALYQSFSNIVLNAIDAMEEQKGGALIITSSNTRIKNNLGEINEGMIISIQDSGVGMDSEAISKIYNPFFSTKYSHIGLGLSMALKSITAHKGTIDIQSEKGEGTIFKIFLPYIKQTEHITEPVVTPA